MLAKQCTVTHDWMKQLGVTDAAMRATTRFPWKPRLCFHAASLIYSLDGYGGLLRALSSESVSTSPSPWRVLVAVADVIAAAPWWEEASDPESHHVLLPSA